MHKRSLIILALVCLVGRCSADPIGEAGLDPVGKIELRGAADPTFESVAKYYPPMKYPREAIGVPEHPQDIGVDYQGRLQFTSAITSNGFPMAWFEVGDPPVALGSTTLKRRLLDGYLPIVVLSANNKGIECEQMQFGWSEGMSPDAELFAFARLIAARRPSDTWEYACWTASSGSTSESAEAQSSFRTYSRTAASPRALTSARMRRTISSASGLSWSRGLSR